jgi:outer membrane protease
VFVGYNYYQQNLVGLGCKQAATNTAICGVTSYTEDNHVLGYRERWNSLRVGLSGEIPINDLIKVSGDVAWLPISNLTATDNHWLRPDINPMKESGSSRKNYQAEVVASYKVTDHINLGVGVRYWNFQTNGTTQFPTAPATSPIVIKSGRTTIFSQVSYSF